LFLVTQKREVRIESNDEQARYREQKNLICMYRPSLQGNFYQLKYGELFPNNSFCEFDKITLNKL